MGLQGASVSGKRSVLFCVTLDKSGRHLSQQRFTVHQYGFRHFGCCFNYQFVLCKQFNQFIDFFLLFFFQANTKGFNYYRSPFCRLKSKLLVSRKLCVSSVSCQHFVAWDIPCRKSKSSSRLIPMSVSILVRSANHPVVSRCPQISI